MTQLVGVLTMSFDRWVVCCQIRTVVHTIRNRHCHKLLVRLPELVFSLALFTIYLGKFIVSTGSSSRALDQLRA